MTYYLKVAVPSPLRSTFDYLLPAALVGRIKPGMRVRVPFGSREVVALALGTSRESAVPGDKLKAVHAVVDDEAALDADTLALYLWASDYYQFPVGQALQTSLPRQVRAGNPLELPGPLLWRLTDRGREAGEEELQRAPRQLALWRLLREHRELDAGEIAALCDAPAGAFLKALRDKGLAASGSPRQAAQGPLYGPDAPLCLNAEQAAALRRLGASLDGFSVHLLEGVTGSGKTEVYLQLIARVLEQGRQVLVLVPEIGLTPQTISRFRRRFGRPIVTLHSGLNDGERFQAWLRARNGSAAIIIGTRSAVFTPLARPGLIIVDEEHDHSYKQQEGFRYSARDLAIYRARLQKIPVLLGSATPSLESLHNAAAGRYVLHRLRGRAGSALAPRFRFIDLRGERLDEGFSQPLLIEIGWHLERGGQVLVFLNRRGWSPILQCHDCGWIAACGRCESSYTLHRNPPGLRCHHCDAQRPLPVHCPDCAGIALQAVGMGTERSEAALQRHFPGIDVLRVDRDSTRAKDSLDGILDRIHEGRPCILVGTQMLAKGHHFPAVTLVAVLDADSGLFSPDFRGQELMGQLLTQVAGRAGRGEEPGEVLIQTHYVSHPSLNLLVREGYEVFARRLLEERRQASLPPYASIALLRAEAASRALPEAFLGAAAQLARARLTQESGAKGCTVMGPLPSPMEKRAGRFRYQLWFQAARRSTLHRQLKQLIVELERHPLQRKVRWSVDIDPLDFS